ncbi:MAG TPA: hypothetical protein PK685_04450 [archaeon]|nr:hypothetical protein [archaeon]
MVLGLNKGHKYEDFIFDRLEKLNLMYPGTKKEGMAGGVDSIFCHNGKPYSLEIKDGLEADYGQKKFNWDNTNGWDWSVHDEVTDFYTGLGVLSYVQEKKIKPNRYLKEKSKITYGDAKEDQTKFEDRTFEVTADALWKYYSAKNVHYIQVGKGYGFYHLDKDIAKLGTPQFNCSYILRFRAKYHDRTDRQHKTYLPTPWNYSFFAVLKVKTKPIPSKYNIEKSDGQELPPINP